MVNLPLTDSIWNTFIILAVILIIPPLMARIRFPRIAGLILAGVIIGPGGFGIIGPTDVTGYFSRIGLLLIMFFAGLGIDLDEMQRTKTQGIIFGITTFAVPWIICYCIGCHILSLSPTSAAVISCILGSHTLISYPIISRHGLTRRKSVTISVTGALIAIVIALAVYSLVQSLSQGKSGVSTCYFILEFLAYILLIIIVFPLIAGIFFRKSKNSNSHFIFVIMMLALCCGLAGLIGIEGILGAFLAGIVLNKYIPRTSPLMNRLDFTGNTLFIPIFLLDTGMMIHPSELTTDFHALILFAVMFAASTAGKWIPSWIIQRSCGLGRGDRMVIFGLSESHAAGALAIAMGAYSVNIIDGIMLSTIILIILFSCILSNFITERGSDIIIKSDLKYKDITRFESILVCLSGPATAQSLLDTSMAFRHQRGNDELVFLHITVSGNHVHKYMSDGRDILLTAQSQAAAAEIPHKMQNRVGNNIAESIIHAAEEFESTQIVLGLTSVDNLSARYYENLIRPIVDNNGTQQTFVRLTVPLNTIRRMIVLVPGPVVQDTGFEKSIESLGNLGSTIGCQTTYYGKDNAIDAVRGVTSHIQSGKVTYSQMGESADMNDVIYRAGKDQLIVIIGQRNTETHAGRAFIHLYEHLRLRDEDCNLVIIYPETTESRMSQSLPSARTDRDLLKLLRI